jgi:hypothetical protein
MERHINEADWKLLRQLTPVARDRFCQRTLSEIARLASDSTTNSHERYLAVFRLVEERDGELAAAFDNMRRSTAYFQLARIRSLGLVTDEEFAGFSAETQEVVLCSTRS